MLPKAKQNINVTPDASKLCLGSEHYDSFNIYTLQIIELSLFGAEKKNLIPEFQYGMFRARRLAMVWTAPYVLRLALAVFGR